MAIASSGAIRLGADIGVELDQSVGTAIRIKDAARGSYEAINTASDDYPDGNDPHAFTEWYGYNHDAVAGFGGIFVDDFHTTGGSDPMDSRISYATTGLQDSQSFPTDGDGNTVTTRPQWTYNNGDAGTTHQNNDTIRCEYATTHPQWRTTNVPTHMNFSGTINIECRFYMSSGNNKDLTFGWDCISQGDYWSGTFLKDGYFYQFDDGSGQWVRLRRRNNNGSVTTLGTSSNDAFTKGQWFTAKFQWNQSTGLHRVWVDGNLKLSVTNTTFDDFCPSGGGIRFMSARYMSSSNFNVCDWIKIWKS